VLILCGDLYKIAWFDQSYATGTHVVKSKQANPWGLFDMLGNMYEWCSDWVAALPSEPQIDPTGPSSGTSKIHKGGNFILPAKDMRWALRIGANPNIGIGFRPVLSAVR
jgi:formylglycine-generating enzyme required for sulfatase activity